MSDIDQNEQRRFQFLRAVYDLANGTSSLSVRGLDVAERLGLDLKSQEFHDLARHHEVAGNTRAIETNWGTFRITNKGIAEVESQR